MAKKSNFDSFKKGIFIHISLLEDNLKYLYTILLPLLLGHLEKLSTTQKWPYLNQKVNNKNLKALSLANIFKVAGLFWFDFQPSG